MQAYLYFAGEDETGWIFKTWAWEPKESRFTGYDIIEYTDKVEYGRGNGEIVVESWQGNKHDYAAFPRLNLPENMKDLIKQGMLLDNGIHIGKPIDEVLAELPNHVGHDYYNGGKYYKYPNGVSVFYDEITREVSNIMVGGRTFINDLA